MNKLDKYYSDLRAKQFNEKKLKRTRGLGMGTASSKVMGYDELSNFSSMREKIRQGR